MPAFVFRRSGTIYYLVRAFDAQELDADRRAFRVASPRAEWLLDAFCRSSSDAVERLVAYVLRETGTSAGQLGLEERDALSKAVRAELARGERGRWLLFARAQVEATYLGELAQQFSVEQKADETFAWIEFDVLDQRGRPIAGAAWTLLRGTEKVRSGRLDAQGNAYADGIDPGSYKIVIADVDPLEPIEPGSWLGIGLVDEAGVPRASEPYQVIDASGARHEGVLDAGGRAMLHGLPAGECKVTFIKLGACELMTARQT
jgi:hypothetical protein